jgi:hypothetical protein
MSLISGIIVIEVLNMKKITISWSMYTDKIKDSAWWEKLGSVRVWYNDGKFARATRRAANKVKKAFK